MADISVLQKAQALQVTTLLGIAQKLGVAPPPPDISVRGLMSTMLCDFSLDSFAITNTRSRHTDTDYISVSLAVGSRPPVSSTRAMGDLNNGNYPVGIAFNNIPVASSETAIFSYAIVNNGHADPTFIEQQLEQLVSTLASKGAQAAATAVGTAIGAAVGASIGTAIVPIIGTALGALTGWIVTSIGGLIFVDCDGPVAAGFHPFTASQIQQATAGGRIAQFTDDNPGTNSPDGCGSNSQYQVTFSFKVVA